MANGTCESVIHLSSLDPGIGKTTSVIHFLKALLSSPAHLNVAALVCVKRRDQIETIVKDAGLPKSAFAVLTADERLNSIGRSSTSLARILFTTHSMIEMRTEGRRFADVVAFHYRGLPRAARIWDEAILPGRPLTVSRDMIAFLFTPLRGRAPVLADALEDLFTDLRSAKNGSLRYLPDLGDKHGVDLNGALRLVHGGPQEQVQAVEALWTLFGRCVTVRQDGHYGNTLLDYKDTLPEDITPLLVLDASVRVRTVYDFWEKRRGGIRRLPTATKRYDNHTIHVWNKAGGKSSFRKEGALLIEGIASTIRTKSEEEWLIIHHKDGIAMDFEQEVRALLPEGNKTHFLHWGAHDATNAYARVPNVILAGILYYRTSHYEAIGRLASGQPSRKGTFPHSDRKVVQLGEHYHLILQALCRGAVRRCEDGGCPPTHTYIIASSRSGIRDSLGSIFPGASVVSWTPLPRALTGKVGEALAFIQSRLAIDPEGTVAFKEVMKAIGWKDGKDFKRRIRYHDAFIEALDEAGIDEWAPRVRLTCFRRRT